jgi:hypothetical protein
MANTEFLQPNPDVAADALIEIITAVISAVLSLDEHMPQTNTSCVPKLLLDGALSYSVFFRIGIVRCFKNNSRGFQY